MGFFDRPRRRCTIIDDYRYSLEVIWNRDRPLLGYKFLNPSTANAFQDDATSSIIETRARLLRFGGYILTNVYAYMTTWPEFLFYADDPIGPRNEEFTASQLARVEMMVVGWGQNVIPFDAISVCRQIKASGVPTFCVAINKDGTPKHPLYTSFKSTLLEYPL